MIALRRLLGRVTRKFRSGQATDLFQKSYLQSLDFDVNTIIDVGVGHGTAELYDAFPNCRFVLVDPQREAASLLRCKPAKYIFVNKGLAASPGTLVLKEQEVGKTTFLQRTPLTQSPTLAEYEVQVTTLDELLDSLEFQGPIGIKIDTEGYDLEVIKGLNRYWSVVQFVICEASVRRRFVGSYQMSELVSHMLSQGFLFFNFLNPASVRPRYYDILFVPRESHLLE